MAWWYFGGYGEGTRGVKSPFPFQSDLMVEAGRYGEGDPGVWACLWEKGRSGKWPMGASTLRTFPSAGLCSAYRLFP